MRQRAETIARAVALEIRTALRANFYELGRKPPIANQSVCQVVAGAIAQSKQ